LSLLAQSGYGRADKVDRGLDENLIYGVIMSPRDELPTRIENDISQLRSDFPEAEILFDPQFYAATLINPRDGRLPDYTYYANHSALGRAQFSPSRIQRIVRECLDYQHDVLGDGLSYLVSPTVFFDDFRDSWSQIAISLASASVDYHATLEDPPPLLLTVAVAEGAFHDIDAVEEFLDAITELDVNGFYLVVRRNSPTAELAMEPRPFAHLMYFAYVLAEINQYLVISGFTDWCGYLLKAVNVDYVASGWFQNLRKFSLARFTPSSGGRQPRPRYSSVPLYSNPLIIPEMEDIYLAGLLPDVLSGSQHDNLLQAGPSKGNAQWTKDVECFAHWYSLSSLLDSLDSIGPVATRLKHCEASIASSQTLYDRLSQAAVYFEPPTGPAHLELWLDSITEFRALANI